MPKDEKKIKEEKRIYKLIEQINSNVDYLCAKQFYNNYYFNRR